jgi:hypothetical protein
LLANELIEQAGAVLYCIEIVKPLDLLPQHEDLGFQRRARPE